MGDYIRAFRISSSNEKGEAPGERYGPAFAPYDGCWRTGSGPKRGVRALGRLTDQFFEMTDPKPLVCSLTKNAAVSLP